MQSLVITVKKETLTSKSRTNRAKCSTCTMALQMDFLPPLPSATTLLLLTKILTIKALILSLFLLRQVNSPLTAKWVWIRMGLWKKWQLEKLRIELIITTLRCTTLAQCLILVRTSLIPAKQKWLPKTSWWEETLKIRCQAFLTRQQLYIMRKKFLLKQDHKHQTDLLLRILSIQQLIFHNKMWGTPTCSTSNCNRRCSFRMRAFAIKTIKKMLVFSVTIIHKTLLRVSTRVRHFKKH